MYVCTYHVCMYVCMYVRTYVRMYVRMYAHTHVCMYGCTYLVFLYVWMYILSVFVCIYVHTYVYVWLYVCQWVVVMMQTLALTILCLQSLLLGWEASPSPGWCLSRAQALCRQPWDSDPGWGPLLQHANQTEGTPKCFRGVWEDSRCDWQVGVTESCSECAVLWQLCLYCVVAPPLTFGNARLL